MKNAIVRTAAAISICALCQPVLAAEDYRPPDSGQRRISAYAGGTIKLPFGQQKRAAPKAALTMGFLHQSGDMGGAEPVRSRVAEIVSFGGSKETKPQLSILGIPTQGFDRKLGMSTLGAIAIGALVGVGALVAVAASTATVPDDLLSGN